MKHVLIITEDVVKIQTLSGILGGLFSSLYTVWLKLRLKLTIVFLKPFFRVSVITSDDFKLKSIKIYYYGDQLALIDYAENRKRHLKITSRLLNNIQPNLFETRLAIHLTYDYFIYAHLYEKLLSQLKPDLVVTLSSSYHEQIARFLAKKNKIKTIQLHWLTFIWLNHWLKKFFFKRQFNKKINQFLAHAKLSPPPIKKLKNSIFLSLDFFRHLKTLASIYKALDKKKQNPWLVTDITNPDRILKNNQLVNANYIFLASFLPKNFKSQPPVLPTKIKTITNLDDFLYNLGLKVGAPMIDLNQTLSQLYQASVENLFKKIKPKSVVVVSDLRFCELALSKAARQNKTRSLLVSPNTLLALDQLNSYNTTDAVTVVGKFIKRQLINIGLDSEKIHIVGDPRTENYSSMVKSLNSKKVLKALNLKPDQNIALLISFPPTSMIPKPEKKAFIKLSAKAIAKSPDTVLVIKPHPSEKRYRIIEDLKEWGITNVIVSDNNQLELADLLNASKVILQTWSMTIFEAIMMDRPVISINPFKKDYGFFLPILKSSAAVKVNTQAQLNHWLKILLDPNQSQTRTQLKKARKACSDFIKTPTAESATLQILKLLKI